MGLFGKSKYEKLEEQIWDTPDSEPEKKLELISEIISLIYPKDSEGTLYGYLINKMKILYTLGRYVESLETLEKYDEILRFCRTKGDSNRIFKSKLLNKMGKYAEALICINPLEEHLAKYGKMDSLDIHRNQRRNFDTLDCINMEIPEVKIYSMYKCGHPKKEIISYLEYLHDKIWQNYLNSNEYQEIRMYGRASKGIPKSFKTEDLQRWLHDSKSTERTARNHQNQIYILMTNVNTWQFEPGLGTSVKMSQNNISKKERVLPKGFGETKETPKPAETKPSDTAKPKGALPKGFETKE
jgi:hypothetical protein